MRKEPTMTRFLLLLPMAACVAMLAGCDEKKEEPKPPVEQPVEVVQESGEDCLQRAIDKLDLGEVDAADAAIKIASARESFAQTDTFLEMIGFSQADIRRIKAQEQRARGLALADELA